MAADLDEAYIRWAHEGLSDPTHSEEISIAQMLDHGSISFGKYAVESLAWEKRSVFTHDRCQEELEKFKAPGLVAKKKAYFEEYYKKIRTLKGLADEDQQTEITLDYGADSSISSQTGEDDETSPQTRDPPVNVAATCHSNIPVEISIEHGSDSSQHFCLEHSVPHSELVNRCSNTINLKRTSSDVSQLTCLDLSVERPGVKILEPCSSDISQVTQLDNFVDLSGSSVEGISPKMNSNDVPRTQCETCDSSVYDAIQPTILDPTGPKPNQRKIPAERSKEDASESEMKESGISIRNHTKPRYKIKENATKSSNQAKYLDLKNSDKGRILSSRKGMAITVPKDNKFGLFASCKEKEIRKDVTIPRPFSFATEKRATTQKWPSTGVSGGTYEKVDCKTANRHSVHAKDKLPSQNILKKATVFNGVKCMLSEKNRHQKSPPRITVVMNSQQNQIKTRDGLAERSKPRPINFPAPEKTRPSSRSNAGVGIKVREDKQEGKDVGRVSESRAASDPTTSTARKLKTQVKKMVSQQNVVVHGSRQRQAVKRWR